MSTSLPCKLQNRLTNKLTKNCHCECKRSNPFVILGLKEDYFESLQCQVVLRSARDIRWIAAPLKGFGNDDTTLSLLEGSISDAVSPLSLQNTKSSSRNALPIAH